MRQWCDRYSQAVQPSTRGELKITSVNQAYLNRGDLRVQRLGRGLAWFDKGACQSLLDAAHFVETVESRQGYKIVCLEESSYNQGWLPADQLKQTTNELNKTLTVSIYCRCCRHKHG